MTTSNLQAIEALRALLAQLQGGSVELVSLNTAVQTAAKPPYGPTGQETVIVVIQRQVGQGDANRP